VYTSSSLSLAALEYLVHLDPDHAPADLIALTLEVPDTVSAAEVDPTTLPRGWAQVAGHPACLAAGDAWVREGASLLLRVPAAPIPEERNLLINPRHAEAVHVRVIAEWPFAFDPRLLP
jgi:RES domain-containing protein